MTFMEGTRRCSQLSRKWTASPDNTRAPVLGKSTSSDYVYVMDFSDGRISHLTKIWNAGLAMKDLGWV